METELRAGFDVIEQKLNVMFEDVLLVCAPNKSCSNPASVRLSHRPLTRPRPCDSPLKKYLLKPVVDTVH